jgi:NADH-quinone oxidoreductase subunit N
MSSTWFSAPARLAGLWEGHLLGTSAILGTIAVPRIDYTAILPELILLGGAIVLLGVAALARQGLASGVYAAMATVVAVAGLVASLVLWHDVASGHAFTAIDHSVVVDGFSVFVAVAACSILVLAALAAPGYLGREEIVGPEYYALALLSGGGAVLMATANDLIVIFLALEILSLPLYVLAGLDQRRAASGEAALKYFILGAFSSAIFLYGIALTYGATGSTNLAEIAAYLDHNVLSSDGILLGGLALLLVGFSFKIAAVPFHLWTPDVYEGAPTPATGFMAAIAKAGGFAALLRVFLVAFSTQRDAWQPVVFWLAILTLVLGAVLAVAQHNVKRMLAYSSINHAGFILLGLEAITLAGVAASLYYVFAYSILTIGTFTIVATVSGRGDSHHDLEDYRGLARRQPLLGLALAVLLLAQAGAPFTIGFLAKLEVVSAVVDAHSYVLAVVAMLSAAVAAFFYLRLVLYLYADPSSAVTPVQWSAGPSGAGGSKEPLEAAGVPVLAGASAASTALGPSAADVPAAASGTHQAASAPVLARNVVSSTLVRGSVAATELGTRIEVPILTAVVIGICVGVTLVFGIWPAPLVDFAREARLALFGG